MTAVVHNHHLREGNPNIFKPAPNSWKHLSVLCIGLALTKSLRQGEYFISKCVQNADICENLSAFIHSAYYLLFISLMSYPDESVMVAFVAAWNVWSSERHLAGGWDKSAIFLMRYCSHLPVRVCRYSSDSAWHVFSLNSVNHWSSHHWLICHHILASQTLAHSQHSMASKMASMMPIGSGSEVGVTRDPWDIPDILRDIQGDEVLQLSWVSSLWLTVAGLMLMFYMLFESSRCQR
jgi:hypothetical protein